MRIFQTFILPDKLVAKYNLSFAAANFSRNLISGGGFDKCYSLIPVNVCGELPFVDEPGYEVVYSNWRLKGGLRAKLAIFKEQVDVYKRIQAQDSVWMYNLNIINALLFILLKMFKPSVKLNLIILDYTPAKCCFEQNFWYLKLIKRADGIISLANSNLFECRNWAVLPGVVPASAGLEPLVEQPNNKYLLSGVLSEQIAQTTMVLEAFSKLPQCELHITGKADNEELIKRYALEFPNIRWHGSVSYGKYLEILHECTFVLSTRNPDYPENQCNFPSKIIESLLHNRIIISTIPYQQLKGIKYFQTSSTTPELLRQSIGSISTFGSSTILEYANQGKKVAEMFSTKVWNETMSLIERCK